MREFLQMVALVLMVFVILGLWGWLVIWPRARRRIAEYDTALNRDQQRKEYEDALAKVKAVTTRISEQGGAEMGILTVVFVMLAVFVVGGFLSGVLRLNSHQSEPRVAPVLNTQADVRAALLYQSSGDASGALRGSVFVVPTLSQAGATANAPSTSMTISVSGSQLTITPASQTNGAVDSQKVAPAVVQVTAGNPLPGSTVK